MKEIIVAVDFSECSVNAIEHAISIAIRAKRDVKLVYVYNPAKSHRIIYKYTDSLDEATKLLEELTARYQPAIAPRQLTFKIREGKIFKEIVDEAKESQAMLIVAGTHGTSGFEEFWIGSNAYRIICAATCPVITLREGVKSERELKRIVMPIDSTLASRQKAPATAQMAKLFGAEVHVLALFQSNYKDSQRNILDYAKQVCEYFEKNRIDFLMTSRRCKNPTEATIDYAKKIEANLITIMTEQSSSAVNLILGAYAQQMIHRSPFPVMSVQPKELLRVLTR
jgi:nucleotide-binding universal stress UspA family protein